jgi:hypothetical protein
VGWLCAKAGTAIKAKASTIDRKRIFCDTKAPLKYLQDGNTSAGLGRRDASCRITLFRRDPVSEVCQCGGIVLAFPSWHFRSEIPHHKKGRSNESRDAANRTLRNIGCIMPTMRPEVAIVSTYFWM